MICLKVFDVKLLRIGEVIIVKKGMSDFDLFCGSTLFTYCGYNFLLLGYMLNGCSIKLLFLYLIILRGVL